MNDSNEILIDKLMQTITEENIDEKLLFYSTLLSYIMDKKECFDININKMHRSRPIKKVKAEFLELESDEDSSSDYEPSDIDSDDSDYE